MTFMIIVAGLLATGVMLVILPIAWRFLSHTQPDKKRRRIIPAEDMLHYARRAIDRDDSEAALDWISQIFEQPQAYQSYPEALSLRVDLLIELERYDEAQSDLERLRQLDSAEFEHLMESLQQSHTLPEGIQQVLSKRQLLL